MHPKTSYSQHYYPFGMLMPTTTWDAESSYRFGFNTQERVDEISGNGNHNTALFWEYDTRLGRRWNLDPKPQVFISDYACLGNNPIKFTDILGDIFGVKGSDSNKEKFKNYLQFNSKKLKLNYNAEDKTIQIKNLKKADRLFKKTKLSTLEKEIYYSVKDEKRNDANIVSGDKKVNFSNGNTIDISDLKAGVFKIDQAFVAMSINYSRTNSNSEHLGKSMIEDDSRLNIGSLSQNMKILNK